MRDLGFCRRLSVHIFESMCTNLKGKTFCGLLPVFPSNAFSSLYQMIDALKGKGTPGSRVFHKVGPALHRLLNEPGEKILFGVTASLVELAERYPTARTGLLIIQTGGAKGSKRNLLPPHVKEVLRQGFPKSERRGEYGMAELTSQAYSDHEDVLRFPPWARVIVRDLSDPFSATAYQSTGGINIVDHANRDTCAFLETQDLGFALDEAPLLCARQGRPRRTQGVWFPLVIPSAVRSSIGVLLARKPPHRWSPPQAP